jgi:hypothetical protein
MLWEFTVFRDLDWRRIAAETHGLPDRAFGSRDEAVFFAPWHFDGNPARVRVEPAAIPRRLMPAIVARRCRLKQAFRFRSIGPRVSAFSYSLSSC